MLRFCFLGEGELEQLMIKNVGGYACNIPPFLLPSPRRGRGAGGEGLSVYFNRKRKGTL
jgi:hypothetical protein